MKCHVCLNKFNVELWEMYIVKTKSCKVVSASYMW